MNTLAPIVLFVYNRSEHTRKTIQALQANQLASDSELFIYSDAPKNESIERKVKEVREYIRSVTGFKNVTLIERDKNWGLAKSIIAGVTDIVNQYGTVIVLEDDLVISPYFLKYMNDALITYKDKKKVMHISGWNYPISTKNLGDIFFWSVMNCWGWATWSDRWIYFEKNPSKLIENWTQEKIFKFNLDDSEKFWTQITSNQSGHLDTWAIFWYVTIFEKNGLCLNPTISYVDNIGHDGSGENCGVSENFAININNNAEISLQEEIIENKIAVGRIKAFYKKNSHSSSYKVKPLVVKIKKIIFYFIGNSQDA